MKGDFSRRTFDASKHYSAVLVEQGRLLTDADSEEEHRILAYRGERAVADLVGSHGGPLPNAGFALSTPDGSELRISDGPYHADGTLLENESEIAYTDQPNRFDVAWPLPEGRHVILLESWRRLVTALEDLSIREVALGGPTTSSREQVVWQVGAVPVEDGWVCTDELPAAEATTGKMAARAEPDVELSSPCLIPPQAGYTGLENQFYRVEIFDSGEAYDLDAAADTVAVTGFGEANQVIVAAIGSLAAGDRVEVYRSGADSDQIEPTFGYITAVDGTTSTLTLSVNLPSFGPTDGPTLRRVDAAFVVSRDNGSVVTTIEAIDGVEVTVHDLGPDDVLGFAVGQLVEISDDRIELESLPRRLHQIADIDQARRILVLRTAAEPLDPDPSGVNPERHPKVRRWDAAGAVRFRPGGTAWIHLENGNQIRFVDGHCRAGDYWTFPARAATVDAASGTIEWLDDGGNPALRSPFGISRHRCVLGYADIDAAGAITDLEDCRNLFPPLTSMRNLLYVGGDGQEGSLSNAVGGFIPLPGQLAIRVANGGFPVEGATVRFRIGVGGGRLQGAGAAVDVVTDAEGLTTSQWDIDDSTEHQLCFAQLLAPSGDPIPHQVVRFHATINRDQAGLRGCCHSVGPDGEYPTLDEALIDLLKRGERDICICLMPGDHKFAGGTLEVASERLQTCLSIHGCGRGTRLHVEKRWQMTGWKAVRLCDVDMLMARDASTQLRDVADVELSGLQVFGVRPDGSLVSVQDLRRLQVTGSVLVARRPDSFDRVRRLLDGLDVLLRPWEFLDELEHRQVVLATARELADLPSATRAELRAELRARIDRADAELSRGEIDAVQQLADVMADEPLWPVLARTLGAIARAATAAHGGVALEIGPAPSPEVTAALPQVSVLISDNDVAGVLTFYGRGEPQFLLDRQTLGALDYQIEINQTPVFGTAGQVHVRNNRIARLALSAEMISTLKALTKSGRHSVLRAAYESFHLTNNVIDGVISEVLARNLTISGNDFTLDGLLPVELPPDDQVARVIGDSATYTGNHVRPFEGTLNIIDATRTSAEAANLGLQIV